jgi:hypothetical protein
MREIGVTELHRMTKRDLHNFNQPLLVKSQEGDAAVLLPYPLFLEWQRMLDDCKKKLERTKQ